MSSSLQTTGSRAIAPSQFKLQFGSIGARGYEFAEGVEVTPAQVVEEAKRIAGGYNYVDGTRQFVIGTFVRGSERKVGEAASQVYDIFGMKLGRLKNVLQVVDNVPADLWNPGIPFEIHFEVANLHSDSSPEEKQTTKWKANKKKDQETLLALAAERKLTVAEFKVAKKAYLAEIATPSTGDATGEAKEQKQSPFHFTFSFRAPAPKESLKDFAAAVLREITTAVTEAVRCYMQPKYAAQKAAKERESKFTTLMVDVPKVDQEPLQKMFDEGTPITAITRAVKEYQEAKSAADALDTLLNTVEDEAKRAEFQAQAQTPGTQIKTVKTAIEAYNKRATNVATINTALDEAKITDGAKRIEFVAQLDATPPVKLATIKIAIKKAGGAEATKAANVTAITTALDEAKITDETQRAGFIARLETEKPGVIKAAIKKAGKDAVAESNRKASIDALLGEIPEEQKADFLATANVNGPVKAFKDKVTAWKATKAQENRGIVDKRREVLREKRTEAASLLKLINQKQTAANTLREASQVDLANAEDEQIANLKAKSDELNNWIDTEDAECRLLLGVPAHPKPSTAKPKGKKAAKRAKKKSGR